ncbi:TetR/AcrR family transcriptional regulator [Nonomuraea sp. NPDC050536]|uniref:TetR/AcrR family transcriptional regulator n=1 Tax=Nonomuraea sp. NPDC050536 TaxID=3364366 RepID=UPI0037C74B49
MPRASRAQAELHRQEVLDAASALVRENGADRVTVPEVMAAAGLTHGGFYRHFRSKDDLLAQAGAAAFAERVRFMERILESTDDKPAARREFIENYLSVTHRDNAGQGCATAALAADVTRAEAGSPLRDAYLDGLRNMIDKLGELGERPAEGSDRERELLIELTMLVGALTLARACAGDDLSERILDAGKEFLTAQ